MRKRFDQTLGKFDEKVFLYTGKAIKIYGGAVAMQKTIEVVYEDGVFKPLEPVKMEEGTKVKVEIRDTSLLKKRLQKYKGILKVKISSEELNELYHEYVTERTDIP